MTREEAKAWFKVLLKDEYAFNSADREAFAMAIKALEQEPKTGHWIDKGSLSCRCSECGCKNNKETSFCPNCGAKMVEPQEREGIR